MDFQEAPKGFNFKNNVRHVVCNINCMKLLNEVRATRFFFESFSFLQFGRDALMLTSPSSVPFSINGILMSAEQTLESLESCCEKGNFSDSYVLVRKYRDDLFFYLYILLVNKENIENFMAGLSESPRNKKQAENINKWLANKLENLHISEILKYIASSQRLSEAVCKYNLKVSFDDIGKKLNNFVHANGISYYNKPFGHYRDDELMRTCEDLQNALDYITVTFLFLSALCNPLSIMSSDYTDYLDFGETPPDNSQYWVAPFVTDYFQKKISLIDKNGLKYLQNETGMQLIETQNE